MKRKQSSRPDLAALCAQTDSDDGLDPKQFFRKGGTRPKTDRKTLQLCSQVAQTLDQSLAASADDVLRELGVASVVPAPDASQLLVLLAPLLPPGPNEAEAAERLARAGAWLRRGRRGRHAPAGAEVAVPARSRGRRR